MSCQRLLDKRWRHFGLEKLRCNVCGFGAPKVIAPELIVTRACHTFANGQNDSKIADYIGVFAVTAGLGAEKKDKYFLDDNDDYSSIMFKSLADRRGAQASELARLLASNL
ncbi:MAG: vitamin B12 dependent-methionine synthase activation domain-containing protein [Polaromonas sp.]